MERELWIQLYVLVVALDSRFSRGLYRASEIVMVFLWAVVNDRPTSWACQRCNWHGFAPRALPSQPTMSKRLRSGPVMALLKQVESKLGGDPRRWWLQRIDSKPLPVGPHSKDKNAQWGHAGGGFARGYKLHTIWGNGPLPSVWQIEPMNVGDSVVARKMVKALPGEGYLIGDRQYDSNPLHRAASPHHQVVAAQQRPGKGLGHRRHAPGRLRALELLSRPFGQALLKTRTQIERDFSGLTCFAAGLAPLPSWVRHPHRIYLWVQAKLLINAIRICRQTAIAME
jgi:Transposase DDE domain